MLVKMWIKENLNTLQVGMKIGTAIVDNSMEILKLKIDLPYYSDSVLWRIYPKEMQPAYERDMCTSMFIAVLFPIKKIGKST